VRVCDKDNPRRKGSYKEDGRCIKVGRRNYGGNSNNARDA